MGAALFVPPFVALRAMVGVPEVPAFCQWMLSLWVLAFGVAYAHAGWRGRVDGSLLALGAFGKGVFVVLMASLSDLVLAVIFAPAWWRGARAPAAWDRG